MQTLQTVFFACILFFFSNEIAAQQAAEKATNQKQRLAQYIGSWHSADNIDDKKPGKSPAIKMTVIPKMDSSSLEVEVFQKTGNTYKLILVELISYDTVTDMIVAAGQNSTGQCFTGKGYFDTDNNWNMQDVNGRGEQTLHVKFQFLNANEVYLEGTTPDHANEWKVKYIKVKKQVQQ